jgi:acyl dehydratase
VSAPAVGSGPADRVVGPLEVTDFVRWMGAINDVDSAVHYDREVAREAGYDAVLAPGMLPASVLTDHAIAWLGAAAVRSSRVRFRAPVVAGDSVTLRAVATGVETAGGEERVAVEVTCLRADGEVAIAGTMTFAVAS